MRPERPDLLIRRPASAKLAGPAHRLSRLMVAAKLGSLVAAGPPLLAHWRPAGNLICCTAQRPSATLGGPACVALPRGAQLDAAIH